MSGVKNQSTLFTNTTPSIVSSNRILYTASSFARSSLLHLQEIGELKALKPHVSKRSGLASYLFLTVISGTGSLNYNGKEYSLQPSDCVFIDCSVPYSHRTGMFSATSSSGFNRLTSSARQGESIRSEEKGSELWTLRWIHFNGPMMESIYSKYCERGGRPVFSPSDINLSTDSEYKDLGDASSEGTEDMAEVEKSTDQDYNVRVNSIWTNLMGVASGSDYMRDMLINQELSTLLTFLMEQSWHPEDQEAAPKRSLIAPVKDYLDANYNLKITLDELADRFYINKYYLSKSFKAQYGVSINQYLLNVRITKAKQLLRFSDKSIEEIGLECGFNTANYLSFKFKEVEGINPSEFREKW